MSSAGCLDLARSVNFIPCTILTKALRGLTHPFAQIPGCLYPCFGGHSLPLAMLLTPKGFLSKCISLQHILHSRGEFANTSISICNLRSIYRKYRNHLHTFLEVMYSFLLLYTLTYCLESICWNSCQHKLVMMNLGFFYV